jgi:hypothetical protein
MALSPFSRLRNSLIYGFADLIDQTFENGKKGRDTIPVPLRFDRARNALEKLWKNIVDLLARSELVEEVYAIRWSLLETKDTWDINPDDLVPLINGYKRVYGKNIQNFKKAYEAFDFTAGEIGEVAAGGLINCVFETWQPTAIFLSMLSALCGLDHHSSGNSFRWNLSKKKTSDLAKLSSQEACYVFGGLAEMADPDDSLWGRKWVLGVLREIEEIAEEMSNLNQVTEIDRLIINPAPTTFLLSNYSNRITSFVLTDLSKPTGGKRTRSQFIVDYDGYRNSWVFKEAIRQQLTQGKGLLCPYWDERQVCCHPEYKAFLEKVWSCTSPDAGCKLWKRMGCLK